VPTYEYACRECGEHLEVVQKFTDDPLTECPACHGRLRKVFGNIGISFKGSGFYKTDSRSDNGNGKAKEKDKEPAKAESTSSTTDTKKAETNKADSSKGSGGGSCSSKGSSTAAAS
jgi:putative FmdB family regulatory protein